MKRAIKTFAPFCHLFSEQEKAGLVTKTDTEAAQAFRRADTWGMVEGFLHGCGVLSHNGLDSWVVSALKQVSSKGCPLACI
jgi:hypothetical protein